MSSTKSVGEDKSPSEASIQSNKILPGEDSMSNSASETQNLPVKAKRLLPVGQILDSLQKQINQNSKAQKKLEHIPELLEGLIAKLTDNDMSESDNLNSSHEKEQIEILSSESALSDLIDDSSDHSMDMDCSVEALSILTSEEKDETLGPAVSAAVASRFNKILSTSIGKELVQKLKSKFQIPENCKALSTPRLNPDIWNQLSASAKGADVRQQARQVLQTKSMIGFTKITKEISKASKTVSKELTEKILRMALDGATLQAYLIQDLSTQRRMALRSHVLPQFKSLCEGRYEHSEMLFGPNLGDALKQSRTVSQIMKRPGHLGSRFQPYPRFPNNSRHLNFRGQTRPQLGATRGRPYYHPQSRQNQRFSKPPQQSQSSQM